MKDRVIIEGLSVMTTVGAYDWEQRIKQQVLLDITMDWHNKPAGISDNINHCLNYAEVSQTIISYLNDKKFVLIERIVEEVATLIINRFYVQKIKVKVSKPQALSTAKNVAVVIERNKYNCRT